MTSRDGSPTFDTTTEAGARADSRLRESRVAWMTTVDGDGMPQTSPIWYLWDGGDILMYSLPSARARNVERHPPVALNLDGDGLGGDIVVVEGIARIDRSVRPVQDNPDYLAKYGEIMAERDWSPEWFGGRYSVPIVITPTKFRYW